jgi:predicted esterase
VLVVSSTSDAKYNSSRRLMTRFTAPALAAGWVVVAADPDQPAAEGDDTNGLRYALIKAALAGLQLQWPGSARWPVAYGGFSGGAKRSAWMAAMSALDGRTPVGVFQGGCNEDAMADALTTYRPDKRLFRDIPVFLSSGDQDPIATPEQQRDVSVDLTQEGFRHVRLESYAGRHEVNAAHITAALQWFAQLSVPPAKK